MKGWWTYTFKKSCCGKYCRAWHTEFKTTAFGRVRSCAVHSLKHFSWRGRIGSPSTGHTLVNGWDEKVSTGISFHFSLELAAFSLLKRQPHASSLMPEQDAMDSQSDQVGICHDSKLQVWPWSRGFVNEKITCIFAYIYIDWSVE